MFGGGYKSGAVRIMNLLLDFAEAEGAALREIGLVKRDSGRADEVACQTLVDLPV